MSKIICDICGTVYPDNAAACPICGYPRQDSEKAVLDETEVRANSARISGTYVKGGRFSSKNVKKRHRDETLAEPVRRMKPSQPARKVSPARNAETFQETESADEQSVLEQPKRAKPSNALKATAAVLAVAVVAVGGYIAWRFYQGANAYNIPSTIQASNPTVASEQMQIPTTLPMETGVSCVGLSVSDESITFEGPGRAWILSVVPIPEDTTEKVVFTSSDEAVVTVNEQGRVTSVGPGEATITITCGNSVRQCKVVCNFDGVAATTNENGETTATTQPTEQTQSTHYQDSNWVMNKESGDVTLIIGEQFSLELNNDAGETANVTWTADQNGVVSIDGNVIKGVSVGMINVTATVDGKTFTCIIRVIENR